MALTSQTMTFSRLQFLGFLLCCALLPLTLCSTYLPTDLQWQRGSGGSAAGTCPPQSTEDERNAHNICSCKLEVEHSLLDVHCQRLERVCLDQGTIVLWGEQYQELQGRRAAPLPELRVDESKAGGNQGCRELSSCIDCSGPLLTAQPFARRSTCGRGCRETSGLVVG